MKQRAIWTIGIVFLVAVLIAPQRMPARAAQPLPTPTILFDVAVSLEWQPGTTDTLPDDLVAAGCSNRNSEKSYVDDLVVAMRQASAYLYSYSQGQMALGRVRIYTGARNWQSANIRVLANSGYRPAAFVGGIRRTPMSYTSRVTGRTQVFYPGKVFLGRLWDGQGARCGAWSAENGRRTIGHEWAHYALFLYDEYFNQNTLAQQFCTSTGKYLPDIPDNDPSITMTDSLMAYHYKADQLWLSEAPLPALCAGTPQMQVHGRSDWNTIKLFYPNLTVPAALAIGPIFEGSPAEASFLPEVLMPASVPQQTSTEVLVEAPTANLIAESYLVRPGANGVPSRIMGQGPMLSNSSVPSVYWGVHDSLKDRAAVFVNDPATGARFAFPPQPATVTPLLLTEPNPVVAKPSIWKPGMMITPVVVGNRQRSEVSGLRVQVTDCAARTKRLRLVYCPAGGTCGSPVIVSQVQGRFAHVFSFPVDGIIEPPAFHGYIHAQSLETGEETIATYQLAGGVGPATLDGHAPLVEGEVDLQPPAGTPPLSPTVDSRLLYSSAQSCSVRPRSLPAGVLGIANTPVNIQPVLTNRRGLGWGPDDPRLHVRLSYNEDLLTQLGISDERLVLLRLNKQLNTWVVVPTTGSSPVMNWIAGQSQAFDGQGETYAIGYR